MTIVLAELNATLFGLKQYCSSFSNNNPFFKYHFNNEKAPSFNIVDISLTLYTIIYLVPVNPTCSINYSQIQKNYKTPVLSYNRLNAFVNFEKANNFPTGKVLLIKQKYFSPCFPKRRTSSSMKRKNNLSLHLFITSNLFFSFPPCFFF